MLMCNKELEIKLAKTGSFDEIKNYLKRTFFCEEAQVELVKRKDINLLYLYMEKLIIREPAQIELAKNGTKEMLLYAISKQHLCKQAVQCLIERFM